MFYVYHLIDPRTGSVFYVGKGCRNRDDAHERQAKAGSNHPKCEVIRSIWAAGEKVKKARIRSFDDEQAAYEFEAREIRRLGIETLTNLVLGGGGVRTPAQVLPIHSAKRLLNMVALACHTKAGHVRINQPWATVLEKIVPGMVRRIVGKYGKEFVKQELARYAIEADFAY